MEEIVITCFPYLARPDLGNKVASLPVRPCALKSGDELVFACLVIVGDDFIAIYRVTFSTSVSVAAVVLKYSTRFMFVPVDRCALNPTLAAVPTHRMVNVDFPPRGFSFEPENRLLGSAML